MADDLELLRRYLESKDQAAFAVIVHRHAGMVYAAALRRTQGNCGLAEDISQEVFAELARQAPFLLRHPTLIGWLYKTTRFKANRALRAELRRQKRHLEAHLMQHSCEEEAEPDWTTIQPLLDGVLDTLNDRDREAVLLRFLQKRRFAEIGVQLRLSEDGARTCVDRALEKMREALSRRGITSTPAAISAILAGPAMATAPAGLAATIAGTVAGLPIASGLSVVAAKFFIMQKLNAAIVGILLLGAAITGVELNSTRLLARELNELSAGKRQASILAEQNRRQLQALLAAGADNRSIAELAQLQVRIAQLQNRPPGVIDEKMKPSTAWTNAGLDSPEAAVETQLWAAKTNDLDVAAAAYFHPPSSIAQAEAFMTAWPAVRARYGTAQRFLAALIVPWGKAGQREPVAFQIVGEVVESPDLIYLKTWTRGRDGFEGEMIFRFDRLNGKWGLGSPSDDNPDTKLDWTQTFSRIDKMTGEIRPLDLQTVRR